MVGFKQVIRYLVLIFIFIFAQLEWGAQFRRAQEIQKEKRQVFFARKDPVLVRILSFGNLPSVIDWIWIQAVAESSTIRVSLGHQKSPFFLDLDVLTDLDPAFYSVYLSGGLYLTVVRDENEQARDLLLKAVRFAEKELPQFPPDFQERFWGQRWEIGVSLAYIYLFELNDLVKAADVYQKTSVLKGAPEYVKRLANKLNNPYGQAEVGLRVIDFVGQRMDAQMKPEKKLRLSMMRQRFKAMMDAKQGRSP